MKKAQTIHGLIKFTNSDGGALDITGCTVTVMMKQSEDDADNLAVIDKPAVIVDAINGVAKVTITPAESDAITTPLVAEAMALFADGNVARTKTLKISFENNVIKAIA